MVFEIYQSHLSCHWYWRSRRCRGLLEVIRLVGDGEGEMCRRSFVSKSCVVELPGGTRAFW